MVPALHDLDGLKRYNDTFGHPAADALLARRGQALLAALDGHGLAYRMGGDEFCIVTHRALAPRIPYSRAPPTHAASTAKGSRSLASGARRHPPRRSDRRGRATNRRPADVRPEK
jgi:GGDEF domain-containing protein